MRKNDSIIYHEAGHALVGYHVGMRLVFADMTCLAIDSPVVGLDCDPVPAPDRPRARALAALAGPIAEAKMNGGIHNWRQDGEVARQSAKALHNDNIEARSLQLIEWAQEARRIINSNEERMKRIYMALAARNYLTGDELTRIVAARVNAAGAA
jgi:ATP-dependent Zn protease